MSGFARLLAVLGVLALLAGCGGDEPDDVALDDTGSPTEEPDEPEPEGNETEEPTDPDDDAEVAADDQEQQEDGGGAQWVTVFLLRDVDGYLWVEAEERLLDEPTQAVATAAMHEFFTNAPVDPGLTAPAGTGVDVLGVKVEDRVLIVDVSDAIYDAATGAAGEAMFLQALAHTGAQFDTVDAVELRVEGEQIDELWGHVELSEPLTPDPYARAAIDVDRPRYGETVPAGPVTITGTSLTFESTVELDLLDPDGNVVEETFTTAQQPAIDQRGPFSHTFDTEASESGTWIIRVREPDPSDGEGRPPYTADIAVEVQ